MRASLTRFVLLSLAALVILGVGILVVSSHLATDEALRDARMRSQAIANGIAAPLVDAKVRAGDDGALDRLGMILENRMRDGSVSHILLWGADGRILWSDERELIGEQVERNPDVADLLGTDRTLSERSGERDDHPGRLTEEESLLEVYVGAVGADGEPFVFEAYIPPGQVAADRDAIFRELLPIGLGGLLLFQLAILPLAFSLARRVDRGRRHRSELLSRSLSSWHEERQRLAQELHDGVVQDLSAASYALPSVVTRLPADPAADAARATGRQIGEILHRDLIALRTLITDLMPADFDGDGLTRALERLAARFADRDLAVRMDVASDLAVGSDVAGLVYRIVREGLHNVDRHAGATSASVAVNRQDGMVEILVTDDGRGPGVVSQHQDGHFGVRLLAALARDVGGSLDLGEGNGGGAVLRVRIPAVLPD